MPRWRLPSLLRGVAVVALWVAALPLLWLLVLAASIATGF